MKAMLVYITTPSREEAEKIAGIIIAERLAACANIFPGITSVYRQEESVRRETETVMIIKTAGGNTEKLTARICELHPYECPCIIVLPVEKGSPDFLEWTRTNCSTVGREDR